MKAVVYVAALAAACARPSPSPERWTMTAEGAGPVRIGMTWGQLAAAVAMTESQSAGGCEYVRPQGTGGLLVMVVDGDVTRIDVTAPGVTTDKGIGVGSTEEEVRSAYLRGVRTERHKYIPAGHYLIIDLEQQRRLVLESDGTHVTRYRLGRTPQVDWVEGCS